MRRLRLAFQVASLTLATAGVVLMVVPPRTSVPHLSLPSLAPGDSATPQASAAADSLAEEIIVANVFAASRTPPNSRYTPPDLASDTVAGMLVDPAAATDSAVMASSFAPALFGTMVGGDGARALLQLDPLASAPRLYAVGERAGGYRVVSIAPREVVLAGPGGRVVLRLPEQEERP